MKYFHQKDQLAWEVQKRTYPSKIPPVAGFDVYGKTVPAEINNGDFYDAIGVASREIEKGFIMDRSEDVRNMVLLLGDATGHGMAAALMATELRALIRAAIRLGVYHRVLSFLINKQLYEDLADDHFVTLLMGRLNVDEAYFRWVSFGHGPIWFYRAADGEIVEYTANLAPLGVAPDLDNYQPIKTYFAPGDAMVVLSDGFGETFSPEREMIGEVAFKELLKEVVKLPLEEVADAFWNKANRHQRDGNTRDDRTFLMIRRHAE
ncbi:PP2C family protein-serine/threonine phosphatase [Rubritalea marina]|uniref:PP2C family protein-serine/threonine phosphatase n=1 Tax=Rubritalea marina TaxID=361055 RepID=UPI00035D80BD|nr:PP2C family protein-serine/threonine phosphatase [Rubritalea marina]